MSEMPLSGVGRKIYYDETMWERLENRIKSWIFITVHHLLKEETCSALFFQIVLIIEFFQLCAFCFFPQVVDYWDADLADYLEVFLRITNLHYVITINWNIFLAIFYISFALLVIMTLLIVYETFVLVNKKQQQSLFYPLKIFSFFAISLATFLQIPMYIIFTMTFVCESYTDTVTSTDSDEVKEVKEWRSSYFSDEKCWEGIHIFHVVVACVGLLVLTLLCIMIGLLYNDSHPSSPNPWAMPYSKVTLFKMLLKVFFPIYFNADHDGNQIKTLLIFFSVLWFILLVFRHTSLPYYNSRIQKQVLVLDSMSFWITFGTFLTVICDDCGYNSGSGGLTFILIGAPFFAIGNLFIWIWRQWNLLSSDIAQNLKSPKEVEGQVLQLLSLIDQRDKRQADIQLEGILHSHINHCENDHCECKDLIKNEENDKEKKAAKKWHTYAKLCLIEGTQKFPKSASLHISFAYLMHRKLNNKFKAFNELIISQQNKPSLQEQFAVYRYKKLIEKDIIEEDMKSTESKGVDITSIVKFQGVFVQFMSVIEKCTALHLDFWRELLDANTDVNKLHHLGKEITTHITKAQELFKQLNELNPNNVKGLQLYGNFLKLVLNDETEGKDILEKATNINRSTLVNKQFIDTERVKYGESGKAAMFMISGNMDSLGTILSCNSDAHRIFSYSKQEMIGQTINMIQPKALAMIHDKIIERYYETGIPRIMGLERIVFPQHKAGWLIPCSIMVKLMPSLEDGIQFVGFLKDIDSSNQQGEIVNYIMTDENGIIHGITKGCYEQLGIPLGIVHDNVQHITLKVIAPDLFDLSEEKSELRKELLNSSATVIFDTTILHSYFNYLENDMKILEQYENQGYEVPKTGVFKVKCKIIEEQIGGGLLNLQMIKIIDVEQETGGNAKTEESVTATQVELALTKRMKASLTLDEKINIKNKTKRNKENTQEDEEGSDISSFDSEEMKEIMKMINPYKKQQQNDKEVPDKVVEDNKDDEIEMSSVTGSMASSMRSGSSMSSVGSAESKAIREFKASVGKKMTPKAVRTLSIATHLIIIIVFVIALVEMIIQKDTNQTASKYMDGIELAHRRVAYIATIHILSRNLIGIADGYYNMPYRNNSEEIELTSKALLSQYIEDLKNLQNDLDHIYKSIDMTNKLEELNTDEPGMQVSYDTHTLPDAVLQYVSRSLALSQDNITEIKNQQNTDRFFVEENGLYELRYQSEIAADEHLKSAHSYLDDKILLLQILTIIVCIGMFSAALFLIPVIRRVDSSTQKVFELFAEIPQDKVKILMENCETFINVHLDDEYDSKEEAAKVEDALALSVKYNADKKEPDTSNNENKNELDRRAKEEADIAKQMEEDERAHKKKRMLASKRAERGIFIKFFIIELLIIAYFLITYFLAEDSLDETEKVANRLAPQVGIYSHFAYSLDIIREYWVRQDKLYDAHTSQELFPQYLSTTYKNLGALDKPDTKLNDDFYSGYLSDFFQIYFDDPCPSTMPSSTQVTDCQNVDGGILAQGWRADFVRNLDFLSSSDQIFNEIESDAPKSYY